MTGGTGRISRRTWVKGSLAGVLLAGLGGVGLALQKTVQRLPTPKLALFDPAEYAILVAIAERICPALGLGAPGATEVGVAARLDAMLENGDPETKKGLKIALKLVDNALTGALTGERVVPFTALSPEQQDRSLAGWRDSDVGFRRTVFSGIVSAVFFAYYGDPRTWKRIGYRGPPDAKGLRMAYAEQLVDLDSLRATPVAKGT